ncbi:MAG: hypothetical protein GY796_11375 [Chloroflexi bacterium]|nr:hypothetical protein [Chloroflexota bacterium]
MAELNKKQQLAQKGAATDSSTTFHLTEEKLVRLIRCLEQTHEDAYSCEEAYALLDEYVELIATDEQAAQLMPLVRNHMDICPDCHEELEVLLNILRSESSSDIS